MTSIDLEPTDLWSLTPPEVPSTLGAGPGRLDGWTAELVARPKVPGLPTVGIWRVRGPAADRTAIMKLLRLPPEGDGAWNGHPDPAHPFYWRREAEIFSWFATKFATKSTGLSPGAGLRPPRCYGVRERDDGTVAIWMEDVSGISASDWDLSRYGMLARQLGHFHISDLTGSDSIMDQPWLSHDWLRAYVGRRDSFDGVLDDAAIWRNQAVSRLLPSDRAAEFRTLWDARHELVDEVSSQPQTLCQLDFHPLNLFDASGDTVVIDWAFAGIGGIGEDLGTLVIDAVADFHADSSELGGLFEILVGNYADAVADAYDPMTARRAIAVAALARYAWLTPALLSSVVEGRPTINGRPTNEAAPIWAAACTFLIDLFRDVSKR